MKLSDKIKHVINSFPCPVTYEPMRKDGLPKKDMFEWMCARIMYLEKKVAIQKQTLELLALIKNKEDMRIKNAKY